jgi:hypothetical protein
MSLDEETTTSFEVVDDTTCRAINGAMMQATTKATAPHRQAGLEKRVQYVREVLSISNTSLSLLSAILVVQREDKYRNRQAQIISVILLFFRISSATACRRTPLLPLRYARSYR